QYGSCSPPSDHFTSLAHFPLPAAFVFLHDSPKVCRTSLGEFSMYRQRTYLRAYRRRKSIRAASTRSPSKAQSVQVRTSFLVQIQLNRLVLGRIEGLRMLQVARVAPPPASAAKIIRKF